MTHCSGRPAARAGDRRVDSAQERNSGNLGAVAAKTNRAMSERDDLKSKLLDLTAEHRGLDDEIAALTGSASYDPIQVQRLKKRKLALKDQIARLESDILPDIIA